MPEPLHPILRVVRRDPDAVAELVVVQLLASPDATVETSRCRSSLVQVGDVDYLVCRQDRLACVEQIRIDPAFRDHKVASAAVRALLDRETDCAWSTTAVVDAPAAAALWRGVEGRVASLGVPVYCEHMRAVPVPDH